MKILRELDPFESGAAELQLHHLEHNRQVMEEYLEEEGQATYHFLARDRLKRKGAENEGADQLKIPGGQGNDDSKNIQ
jgi:hypothetical protein